MRPVLIALVALCATAAPAAAQAPVPDPTLPPGTGGGSAPPSTPTGPTTPPPITGSTKGTVPAVLDAALRAGSIAQADHDRHLATYQQALAARDRLPRRGGDRLCRDQLATVIGNTDRLARKGLLTSSRMPAVFLQLRRNAEFWVKRPSVKAGQRLKFGAKSELLFQHYAGEGVQLQPLANFGKLNGLLTECGAGTKCERTKIRRLLAELVPLTSQRAGYATWEYFFPFGGGQPPWNSGLAQGTAIQALARAAQFTGDPQYRQLASRALGIFQQGPPDGVRVRSGAGYHYLIYSFAPRLRVLNGFLQAVTGLYDYAKLTGDPVAQQLFEDGDRAAQEEVPRYDTGSWSYYALPGKGLSTYGYHALVTRFLENLCHRTGAGVYCETAKKFEGYLARRPKEPERPLPPARRCGYPKP